MPVVAPIDDLAAPVDDLAAPAAAPVDDLAAPAPAAPAVDALLFDVFGTVVDWHSSIVDALRAAHAAHGPHGPHAPADAAHDAHDWPALATAWRAGYIRTTLHVARGGDGPATVDEMHRLLLDDLLASPRWRFLAARWDDPVRTALVHAWHRLRPWPDAVPALHALRSRYIVGTLSNGNVRLLVDMAKHARLPWDVIFSSELFASYKPNPAIYAAAVRCLALPPHRVALVASHIHDCAAAKACGLAAIYVPRPTEDIAVPVDHTIPDLVVRDFHELARVMGVPPAARL